LEVRACGEGGCEGKQYFHDKHEMAALHEVEKKEVKERLESHGKKIKGGNLVDVGGRGP